MMMLSLNLTCSSLIRNSAGADAGGAGAGVKHVFRWSLYNAVPLGWSIHHLSNLLVYLSPFSKFLFISLVRYKNIPVSYYINPNSHSHMQKPISYIIGSSTSLCIHRFINFSKLSTSVCKSTHIKPNQLSRSFSSLSRSNAQKVRSFSRSNTMLCLPTQLSSFTRGMVAPETLLKIVEIKSLNRILYHNHQMLRNGPASLDSLLRYATNVALIDLKVAQHFLTCAYPGIRIPYEFLRAKYPNLKINSSKQVLGWDDYLTASIASQLQKHEPFKTGSFHVLGNINYDPKKMIQPTNLPNEISLKQTGQQNCDYMIERHGIQRCFDLKGGKIKPMAGHTYITSDIEKYETTSDKIFKDQLSFFKGYGETYKGFAQEIENLLNNKALTWVDRNIKLHEYYALHWSRLPTQSPSMIFHVIPEYDYTENNENNRHMKRFQGKSGDLMNLEKTQDCIIDALINGGKIVTKNYFSTPEACEALRARLRKRTLEIPEICDWLSTT
jgi:hypothetical protein